MKEGTWAACSAFEVDSAGVKASESIHEMATKRLKPVHGGFEDNLRLGGLSRWVFMGSRGTKALDVLSELPIGWLERD